MCGAGRNNLWKQYQADSGHSSCTDFMHSSLFLVFPIECKNGLFHSRRFARGPSQRTKYSSISEEFWAPHAGYAYMLISVLLALAHRPLPSDVIEVVRH